MSNKEKFIEKKRKMTNILILVNVIAGVIFVILLIFAITKKSEMFITMVSIYGLFIIGIFIMLLILKIKITKIHTYKYNGHEICIYLDTRVSYLLLDDEIVDKHTGSWIRSDPLQCDLDGEKVTVVVGVNSLNNYTLRIGDKIIH